ncbi:DUF2255 family protein [Candidatus Neomarinimicrobiota bacterium]
MTKREIIRLVHDTENPLIKAGENHNFNYIWIVVTGGRLFCRQYDLSERSWYSTFLNNPNGYIKCGDTIIKVNGVIPNDLNQINYNINKAYIEKYANRFNSLSHYAHEMTEARFMEKTMELRPIIEE